MLTIKNPKTYDWANMPLSDCCEGNAMDSHFTLRLFDLLMEKIEEDMPSVIPLLENVLSPANEIFSVMEYNGLDVSPERLKTVGHKLRLQNADHMDNLYFFDEVVNADNLASTNDLREILYTREGGFEFYPPDRTATGTPSVSAPTLKLILEDVSEELAKR